MPHKTRFHELAHVLLGHTAEGVQADGEITPRNLRECEAEAVALLCCAALDLPGVEHCRGYIQSWWGAGNTRLREQIAALAALQYDHAQILDGRVMNPAAAAVILQAVQAHVRALVACVPRATPARVQPAVVDTAAMTDAELYAYYKRTAPAEDLRFLLRRRLSDALRRRAEAIDKPTARDLASLREAWRIEREAERRAAGLPAIGTAEWHRHYASPESADAELPTVDAGVEKQPTADALAGPCGVSS